MAREDYPVIPSYVGGAYGLDATQNRQPFGGIVIHVTGKPDLQSELDYMSKPDPNRPGQYGYHFLIDRDGKIYQTAPFNVRTNHILPSQGFSNNNAIGVAFVGGNKGMTAEQLAAGEHLVPRLQSQFHIPTNMVVSHGQLDPETRGPGHQLGIDDSAEGQQFMTAFGGGRTNVYTGPSRPATPTPGTTINTSPMDLVANLESGNRNIQQQIRDKNTAMGTPAGGYFQIIDPTWATYAPKAGVDLKLYPTAMSAPRDIQAQVASAIPVNQWGPSTVAALKAKYPGIDTSLTLGQFQSQALGGSGAVAGGQPAPAPAGALAQPAGGLAGALGMQEGSPQAKTFDQGMKQFSDAMGGDQQQQDQGMQLQPMQPMMARNVSPLLGGAPGQPQPQQAQQIRQQMLADLAKPLQGGGVDWNAALQQYQAMNYGLSNYGQGMQYGTSLMDNSYA